MRLKVQQSSRSVSDGQSIGSVRGELGLIMKEGNKEIREDEAKMEEAWYDVKVWITAALLVMVMIVLVQRYIINRKQQIPEVVNAETR